MNEHSAKKGRCIEVSWSEMNGHLLCFAQGDNVLEHSNISCWFWTLKTFSNHFISDKTKPCPVLGSCIRFSTPTHVGIKLVKFYWPNHTSPLWCSQAHKEQVHCVWNPSHHHRYHAHKTLHFSPWCSVWLDCHFQHTHTHTDTGGFRGQRKPVLVPNKQTISLLQSCIGGASQQVTKPNPQLQAEVWKCWRKVHMKGFVLDLWK